MEKIGVPKLPSDQSASLIYLPGRDLLALGQVSRHGVGNQAPKSKVIPRNLWKIRIIDAMASCERAKMTPSCEDADPFSKCGGTTQNPTQYHA